MFNKNCFKDKVKCEECKHWIDKGDAQRIEVDLRSYFYDNSKDEFYCNMHKKKYDRKIIYASSIFYFKEMLVNENGEPIGYTKIKNDHKTKN